MNPVQFREEIQKILRSLPREANCEIIQSVGPFIVIVESKDFRLRFTLDRADVFVDVASKKRPEDWKSIFAILDEIKRTGSLPYTYKYSNRLSAVKGILKKTLPAIMNYLTND